MLVQSKVGDGAPIFGKQCDFVGEKFINVMQRLISIALCREAQIINTRIDNKLCRVNSS